MIKQGLFILLIFGIQSIYASTNENRLTPKATQTSTTKNLSGTGFSKWVIVLEDPRSPRRKRLHRGVGYQSLKNYDNDRILERLTESIVSEYRLELDTQWPIISLNVHCLIVTLDNRRQSVLKKLSDDERVRWVQPYNEFTGTLSEDLKTSSDNSKTNKTTPTKASNQLVNQFSDPYFKLQSSFKQLRLEKLLMQLDGDGVTVAVVDSGVSVNHPDLKSAKIHHLNFVDAQSDNPKLESHLENEYHGTAVASLIVAQRNNQEGMVGIAPSATLYGYRGCWQESSSLTKCNSLSLSRALDEAVRLSPDIINLSLTGPQDRLLNNLLNMLISQGTLVVTAYDKERLRDRFPKPQPGVYVAGDPSVDSINMDDVSFVPGNQILTASPGTGYDFRTGHSLSAAQLTGILALIKQHTRVNKVKANLLKLYRGNEFLNVGELFCELKSASC
ncbi:S8 family peptidase [Pleionea sediminis]|uniref:S8 family peptidase n=1 Tax=Pleionea sediminis TaxID=2569479 RepID=UPI0013DE5C29|nr:S8/S53 family peptidase [Pleionea sediminis]